MLFDDVEINTLLLPLGIIPALFILYVLIGGYEGKFTERHIFLTFIVGIVMGAIIYLIEGLSLYPSLGEAIYLNVLLLLSLFFAILDQLVKLATLNLKRFADDGLPIYGATFGLGYSSTFAPLIFGQTLEISENNALLILLPVSFLLMNCATGVLIGIGIKNNRRTREFLKASGISIILWIIVLLAIAFSVTEEFGYAQLLSLVSLMLSIVVFYQTYKNILPKSMLSKRELRSLL